MRKNIILITFLFFTTFLCSAQKDSTSQKKVFGIKLGFAPSFSNDGLTYNANISVEKGKNFVAIGPIFAEPVPRWNYNSQSYPLAYLSDKKISLNGINFVYQRNPNPKGKRFDFYFQFLFNFFNYKDKGFDDYTILNNQIYMINLAYSLHKSALSSTIGYGFKCKIIQNFYIFQDLGIGAGYTRLLVNHDAPNFSTNRKNFDSIIGFNLGLEYGFDRKNK